MPIAKEVRVKHRVRRPLVVNDSAYTVKSRECYVTHYRLVSELWTESTGRAFDRRHKNALHVRVVAKHINLKERGESGRRLCLCRIEYHGSPAAVTSYLATVPGGEHAELTEYGAVREFDF